MLHSGTCLASSCTDLICNSTLACLALTCFGSTHRCNKLPGVRMARQHEAWLDRTQEWPDRLGHNKYGLLCTMARRPFLTSLVARVGVFKPTGSKGKELMKPDCKHDASQHG